MACAMMIMTIFEHLWVQWGGVNDNLIIQYNVAFRKENPPTYFGNPTQISETVQGPEKDPPRAPKMTEMTLKKIPSPRHTHSKHILQKNWSKMIICGLSSGQTNLHPPIWGHGRQLDDRHRHPNINIREIIWLGNKLYLILPYDYPRAHFLRTHRSSKTI